MGPQRALGEQAGAALGVTILVLDAGGLSHLAGSRARLAALREEGLWPPHVPAIVLAEALTGDHRRDVASDRLLRACQVREVTELLARHAAALRTRTGRAGRISPVDAVVVAYAAGLRDDPVVLTSDPRDLRELAAVAPRPVAVVAV